MPKLYLFKSKRNTLKLHCLFWLILITYEVLVTLSYTGKFAEFHTYIGAYLLNITLFYSNTYLVLARSITEVEKSYSRLFALLLLELLIYITLKWSLARLYILLELTRFPSIPSLKYFIVEGIWRAVYFIGLSTAYWFALKTIRHQQKIARLESKVLRSQLTEQKLENAYLQAQINPHFLFNTLNFLYNTVSKLSSKASDTVLILSDMMRYALNEQAKDSKVELDDELVHIRNFIRLAQMRHEHKLNVQYLQEGSTENLRIIPLALITLVENVFKYGELHDPAEPAFIHISVNQKTLQVGIRNRKRAANYPHSHGLGVNNVRKRLDTYYRDRYTFVIQNEPETYILQMTINL